jgi:RND family efflux transporter MFP subunit
VSELKDDLAALRIDREPESAGSSRWPWWIVAIVLLSGAAFGVWFWATRTQAVEVQAATVTARTAGTQAAVLNASGYVTARRRATISSKITGKVVAVNVEEGMAVTEGQILARLDDVSARASLALAQAQVDAARRAVTEDEVHLAQARVTYARDSKLLASGVSTQEQVDQAKLDVDSTAARIATLREQVAVAERQVTVQQTDLDNTIIRAPFAGIVVSKDAQPGEMVSPVSAGGGFTRTGICTVVDMHSLEIDVDVNESYINRVAPNQGVTAVLDAYPDWQIPAHVITIVPTADRQKATVLVRIAFEKLDPRILPDMGVKVTFLRDEDQAARVSAQPTALVPKDAVLEEGSNAFVFVVRGETVERRAVRLGATDGDRREVLAGLVAGDRVVVTPPAGLRDGTTIKVMK